MTVADVPTEPKTVPPFAVRSRRRLVVTVATVTALVLVGLAGLSYWRWRIGATDLFSYGGVNQTSPMRLGEVLYVGADIQPRTGDSGHRRLTVHHIAPQLTVNSAGAIVQVLACQVANPDLGLGIENDTSPCARVRSFQPGTIDLGFPATEIVYKITATRIGIIQIEGAQVSYSDGSRRGDQHAGSGTRISVTASPK